MEIKWYEPGDEEDIIRLFSKVFGRELDKDLWYWRFRDSPYGKGIIALMYERSELISQYSVAPLPLMIDGKIEKAVLPMTIMTHPNHRGKGIFPILASKVFEFCKQSGYKAVFGFPNSNIYNSYLKKLNWHGFGNIEGLELPHRDYELLNTKCGLVASKLSSFNREANSLWEGARGHFNVVVPRTEKYLNWRYFEKPGDEYVVYCIRNIDGEFVSLIVLKIYSSEEGKIGHIVDYLCKEQGLTQKASLNKAMEFFKVNEVSKISCWIPSSSPICSHLKRMGFLKKVWPTFFGVRILDESDMRICNILKRDNWWLTMGDSDVF